MKKIASLLMAVILTISFVSSAFAEASKPNISGVLWMSYSMYFGKPTVYAGGVARDLTTTNQFEIKRLYVTADGELDKGFTYKATLELKGTGAISAVAKTAYLKWAVSDLMKQTVTFGLQPTLTFSLSESFWGYRVVAKSPRDNFSSAALATINGLKTTPSADLGVTWTARPHEYFGVAVQAANGGGYDTPEANKDKRFSATVTFYPLEGSDQLPIEIYLDTEPGYNDGVDRVNRNSLGLFVGYKATDWTIGIDYFSKTFKDKVVAVSGSKKTVESTIVAGFGSYRFTEKTKGFLRYDMYTPVSDDKILGATYGGKSGESLLIAGLDCGYGPGNSNFILSYAMTSYSAKFHKTTGGAWESRDANNSVTLDWVVKF